MEQLDYDLSFSSLAQMYKRRSNTSNIVLRVLTYNPNTSRMLKKLRVPFFVAFSEAARRGPRLYLRICSSF